MQNKIRVLHLNASDSGGASVFAENLIHSGEGLLDAKHLVFTGKHNNFTISGIKVVDNLLKFALHGIEKFIFLFYEKDKKNRFKFSFGYPGIPFFLLKKKIKKYDIIHIHWINKGFVDINDLKYFNKPIVWTCHDIWPATGGCHLTEGCLNYMNGCGNCHYLNKPHAKDLSYRLFLNKSAALKSLNIHFISPSYWLYKQLKLSPIFNNQKLNVINNGIDISIFNNQNTNHSGFVVGFVAQNLNDENKALFRLIEAVNLIENKGNIKLLFIGEQKSTFNFSTNVEIKVISYVNSKLEMSKLYNEMDVLVCTSTIETFPTTLMEAACCGVSCIGFNVGGVKEILDKCSGKVVEPFDIIQLSNEINQLRIETIDKNVISQKSQNEFSILKTVNDYLKVYQSVING